MEVFEAKFDYVKQRKDVLSFKKGDKFYVIDKPNDEWWSARKVEDNAFGYVPSMYLEKSKEQFIGRLVPEGRRNTSGANMPKREHDIHLQALSELHQRVKPLPAHVLGQALGVDVPKEPPPPAPQHITNQQRQKTPPPPVSSPPPPDYDFDDDEDAPNGVPYHHKLNLSGRQETGRFIEVIDDHLDGPPNIPPTLIGRVDEDGLIQPKPLLNPVMESPMHKNLHRELRIRSQYPRRENTGSLEASGRSVLKQDELKKVFRDRSHKQSLKVMDAERNSRRTSLDVKLGERLKLTEEEESFKALETLEKAALQPEFMNLTLKSRSGSGKS
ncbi:actin cytoskeleton-regulatory complex protein SLA1 isoform X9 [Strongylocentrotus purpuratus]|uniref:SH3 domain-containing protein n=1 Tax=Strongylocentrotus purpuratus TaxID=7668 RepID=A0A7M7MYP7_STRPU|nr:actin cytoskeleton-regulatory complex protein SLA1 isoform X9 [Strongylocentrotus purpuratus]